MARKDDDKARTSRPGVAARGWRWNGTGYEKVVPARPRQLLPEPRQRNEFIVWLSEILGIRLRAETATERMYRESKEWASRPVLDPFAPMGEDAGRNVSEPPAAVAFAHEVSRAPNYRKRRAAAATATFVIVVVIPASLFQLVRVLLVAAGEEDPGTM